MPPPGSRMKTAQKSMIRSALDIAIKEGERFISYEGVSEYLEDAGVKETVLTEHSKEVFNCYLSLADEYRTLQDEQRKGKTLSPPPSEVSPTRGEGFKVDDDRTQAGGIAPPVFCSEKIVNISLFRPRFGDFGLGDAKNCEGKISYISERFLRERIHDSDKPSVVLKWYHIEQNVSAYTRFIVVKSEFLSGCEVALGEDCGKQDIEDEDDGESFTDEEHDANDDDTSDSPEQSIGNNMSE
ncbi:hypothetical protein BKA65DRAFT_485517 [Rhexocercosporidium sp. MPI-PUGE-AT-0058]|nr:hypothetical protein BKA65DRAFT_485517 [Rhexocercosporidium sp. MPI-PUGE-AT-0058]